MNSLDNINKLFDNLDYSNILETYNEIPNIIKTIKKNIPKSISLEERNQIMGTLAEQSAKSLLKIYSTKKESRLLESVIFEYAPNKTTEVDLIFLTKRKVYLIECKFRSQDITLDDQGNFLIADRIESPLTQNTHHVRKMLEKMTYGNLLHGKVMNIVYLLLNNCKMTNPTTFFTKDEIEGAFAGYDNLIPLIHKIEEESEGKDIPIDTIYEDILKSSKYVASKKGLKEHIKNLKGGNK